MTTFTFTNLLALLASAPTLALLPSAPTLALLPSAPAPTTPTLALLPSALVPAIPEAYTKEEILAYEITYRKAPTVVLDYWITKKGKIKKYASFGTVKHLFPNSLYELEEKTKAKVFKCSHCGKLKEIGEMEEYNLSDKNVYNRLLNDNSVCCECFDNEYYEEID